MPDRTYNACKGPVSGKQGEIDIDHSNDAHEQGELVPD